MSRIFGQIRQNGYVVRDIEAAMRHWVEVLGVGPWFYAEQAPIRDFVYRGEPSDVAVSIALANSGTLQVELIQQRNAAPSLFKDSGMASSPFRFWAGWCSIPSSTLLASCGAYA